MDVTLGPDEIAVAKLIGSRRFGTSRRANSPCRHYPHDNQSEEQDWHAAGAEIAACRALGGWWCAISSVGADNAGADINVRGRKIQVRHSIHTSGFLMIYPEDNSSLPFVFVVGQLPNYRVAGWIMASVAKDPARWTETNPRTGKPLRCPAFVSEQSDLNPLRPDFGAREQATEPPMLKKVKCSRCGEVDVDEFTGASGRNGWRNRNGAFVCPVCCGAA